MAEPSLNYYNSGVLVQNFLEPCHQQFSSTVDKFNSPSGGFWSNLLYTSFAGLPSITMRPPRDSPTFYASGFSDVGTQVGNQFCTYGCAPGTTLNFSITTPGTYGPPLSGYKIYATRYFYDTSTSRQVNPNIMSFKIYGGGGQGGGCNGGSYPGGGGGGGGACAVGFFKTIDSTWAERGSVTVGSGGYTSSTTGSPGGTTSITWSSYYIQAGGGGGGILNTQGAGGTISTSYSSADATILDNSTGTNNGGAGGTSGSHNGVNGTAGQAIVGTVFLGTISVSLGTGGTGGTYYNSDTNGIGYGAPGDHSGGGGGSYGYLWNFTTKHYAGGGGSGTSVGSNGPYFEYNTTIYGGAGGNGGVYFYY